MRLITRVFFCLLVVAGALAPAPLRAGEESPYGINAHLPRTAELNLVAQAGIGWIRVDFNWYLMQPTRDSFDWTLTDQIVDQAVARGLSVFATLAYTPGWANGGAGTNVPPTNSGDWYAFVFATVSRYRDRVQHWGMWNEPNLVQFYTGGVQSYIRDVLTVGSKAAKAADPGCLVLGPELAQLGSGQWRRWFRTILKKAASRIDIVTHHMYDDTGDEVLRSLGVGGGPLSNLNTPLGIKAQTPAADKPFWLTETGWRTDVVTETQQADYYVQVLDGVLAGQGIDKVFFYDLSDDPRFPEEWGILTSTFAPKETWYRYEDYILTH